MSRGGFTAYSFFFLFFSLFFAFLPLEVERLLWLLFFSRVRSFVGGSVVEGLVRGWCCGQ